jgi:hypothetical protein
MQIEYLVVGSGLTGAVIARTLADAGRRAGQSVVANPSGRSFSGALPAFVQRVHVRWGSDELRKP